MPERADCLAIVRAVAALARNLHIASVAEGIETLDHFMCITQAGCDEVQGFYFSEAVPTCRGGGDAGNVPQQVPGDDAAARAH